jgi:hypothetical protein
LRQHFLLAIAAPLGLALTIAWAVYYFTSGRFAVVVFLASDAAHMVSGATYDVTAGDSAHNTA